MTGQLWARLFAPFNVKWAPLLFVSAGDVSTTLCKSFFFSPLHLFFFFFFKEQNGDSFFKKGGVFHINTEKLHLATPRRLDVSEGNRKAEDKSGERERKKKKHWCELK